MIGCELPKFKATKRQISADPYHARQGNKMRQMKEMYLRSMQDTRNFQAHTTPQVPRRQTRPISAFKMSEFQTDIKPHAKKLRTREH